MIACSANLFRIASMCVSTDKTRYYLAGVQIEQAPQGVFLVATDGAKLLCIWDESGTSTESPGVFQLPRDMLAACGKALEGQAKLEIDGHRAVLNGAYIADNARIDGTFPDWRRVCPKAPQVVKKDSHFPTFAAGQIEAIGEIAIALERHYGTYVRRDKYSNTPNGRFQLCWSDSASPAVVLFAKTEVAFGIVMPCSNKPPAPQVPSWARALG
jgi:hypothetical protein